jgi:hypothetical protein
MDSGETFYGPRGEPFRWAPLFYVSDSFFIFLAPISPPIRTIQTPGHSSIGFVQSRLPFTMNNLATSHSPRTPPFIFRRKLSILPCRSMTDNASWARIGNLQLSLPTALKGNQLASTKVGWRLSQAARTPRSRYKVCNCSLLNTPCVVTCSMPIKDQSTPRNGTININMARSRLTTLQEMLEYSSLPLSRRPIVNALNLPLPPGLRAEQRHPFSNEHVAWLRTLGNRFCFGSYPTSSTRWSLVAFNGALHYFHIDSDGFGTWVEVKTGLKLWVIARPKDASIPSFGEIDGFLKILGDGTSPNPNHWILEAVVLAPGHRL